MKIKLKKTIKLCENKVFLACSGGVDSMVLFHLLLSNNIDFTVLHVNYRLRGDDSNKDEEFVKRKCEENKINYKIYKLNDLEVEILKKSNLQEKARELRYNWFYTFLEDSKSKLLLAHHADDQIETFYLNLARKSGVKGLSCMLMENNNLYRPLLNYSKNDLIEYAKEQNINWRDDSSNFESKYQRNKLRNEILPDLYLKQANLKNSVLTIIKCFQKTNIYNKKLTNVIIKKINKSKILDINIWEDLNDDQKILIITNYGFNATQVYEIDKLINSINGKKIISKTHTIFKENQFFYFEKNIKLATKKLKVIEVLTLPKLFDKKAIYLDAEKISGELKTRKWVKGDRINILGLNGSKLVSDIIKDAKIKSKDKNNIYIVHDERHIYYCENLAISKHSLASSKSNKILKIRII